MIRSGFRRWAGAAGILLAVVGCATFRKGPVAREEPATLILRNDSYYQATIYIVSEGSDSRRLGVVFGGRTDTLAVAPELIRGSVNIVARLLARSDLPQTGRVSVHPGEWYEVTLTADAKMMSFLPARE